jgi:hypothetical protein
VRRWTLRYSSGAYSSLLWASKRTVTSARDSLMSQYPELGAIVVVPYPPPEHDLSPGHERAGG